MKLTKAEQKLLIKILENTIERFEPDDLIHMIRGPKYHMVLDQIYTDVFRPHIKYGMSVIDSKKEMDEKESIVIDALWEKLSLYLKKELGDE
jgi:hypothetical protein